MRGEPSSTDGKCFSRFGTPGVFAIELKSSVGTPHEGIDTFFGWRNPGRPTEKTFSRREDFCPRITYSLELF